MSQENNIDGQDLDLVDDSLEDSVKDSDELWDEFDAEERGDTEAKADDEDLGGGDADDSDTDAVDDDENSPPADNAGGKSDQSADVWADAKPEQKAAYEAAVQDLERLKHADQSNRGRISAMQRQINNLQKGTAQAATSVAANERQQQRVDGFLDSEDWKAFAAEYPEVAKPMGSMIGSMQAQMVRMRAELDSVGQERRVNAIVRQEEMLDEKHSDWREVTATNEFGDWLKSQPLYVQEAAMRNGEEIMDADEAADIVGRFKATRSNGQPTANDSQKSSGTGNDRPLSGRRQRQLESARTAPTRKPSLASGIPEDGDPEQIWKQFDEMDRRQAR